MMKTRDENYNKVINLLRNSGVKLDSTEEIEAGVIKRISATRHPAFNIDNVVNFLFGWVYIGWVRRSLIAASLILIMVFVYQQGVILRQINYLSRRTIVTEGTGSSISSGAFEKQLLMFKLTGRRLPAGNINITQKQLDQLLESVNELQDKYRNLINLIDSDPELKKYIENKLNEKNRTKINL
jgi:hypothetical protein